MHNQKINNKILVKLEDLKEIYSTKDQRRWLKMADDRKIVPLKASPVLAQICGHLIGDGYLHLTTKTGGHLKFFGDISKLKEIAKIYEKLFNKKIKVVKRKRSWAPGHKLEFTDSIVVRCLHKIGVPSGDKVITKFGVPSWILEGDKEVKRKFVQALFDDELEGLYKQKNKCNSWTGLRLSMNKSKALTSSAIRFFNQLESILKEFKIETTGVKIYDNVHYIRKDKIKRYRISLRIKNNIKNRGRFFEEIGFIYDKRKQKKLVDSLA